MQHRTVFALALVAALVPAAAHAQQKAPARRQAAIEIRGQVPTPQVVTVRPREVPAYSRQVLVPNFFDHDFWPSILPAYQLVPQRAITGTPPADAAALEADSLGGAVPAPAPVTVVPNGTPAPATPAPASTSPTTTTTPPTSGTAPARPSR